MSKLLEVSKRILMLIEQGELSGIEGSDLKDELRLAIKWATDLPSTSANFSGLDYWMERAIKAELELNRLNTLVTVTVSPEKDALTVKKLIHGNDFELLRAQKIVLFHLSTQARVSRVQCAVINGIMNLLDEVQDIAADRYDIDLHDNEEMDVKQANEVIKNKCEI